MRYILDEKIGLSYNASSKARDDVSYFLNTYRGSNGDAYTLIGNNDKTKIKSKIGKAWLGITSILKVFVTLTGDDILFVQSSSIILNKILPIKKIKKFKIIYLVHDLDDLRDSYDDMDAVNRMIKVLNGVEVVICHNESMREELLRRGCTAKLVPLEIFDYNVKSAHVPERSYTEVPSVCFAGNLSYNKTGFLYKLDKSNPSYTINVYGKLDKQFSHLIYKGCFAPEELVEKLEANYGLIWEGNDYKYDEKTHPYIMLNNPHKTSLYIVARLPIIIWEKAAMATFVRENGIGITIGCITELEERLQQIDEVKYKEMLDNIDRIREQLIRGEHVHNAIQKAERYILK